MATKIRVLTEKDDKVLNLFEKFLDRHGVVDPYKYDMLRRCRMGRVASPFWVSAFDWASSPKGYNFHYFLQLDLFRLLLLSDLVEDKHEYNELLYNYSSAIRYSNGVYCKDSSERKIFDLRKRHAEKLQGKLENLRNNGRDVQRNCKEN